MKKPCVAAVEASTHNFYTGISLSQVYGMTPICPRLAKTDNFWNKVDGIFRNFAKNFTINIYLFYLSCINIFFGLCLWHP